VIVGAILFGAGPLTLLSGTPVSLAEGLVRCLAVVAYVSVSMLGLAAIGVLLSTLTTVPVGAMAATAILAVAAQIVGQIPQLSALHPYLFTDRWLDFGDLLRSPISWDSFLDNALLQAVWIVAAGALAVWRFTTRDVLT
jgi:ABC-2 type transport system permease protein